MLAFVVLFGDVKDLDRKVVRASKRIKLTDAAVLDLSSPPGTSKDNGLGTPLLRLCHSSKAVVVVACACED